MVSNSAGAPGGLSCNSTNPARSSSDPSRAEISDETGTAPTDHLRQSYSSQGFSSEASSLTLSSWRDKTNSNYSSFFAKWARWCHQWGRNPLSGPITDVINFLADLSALRTTNISLLIVTVQQYLQYMKLSMESVWEHILQLQDY